MLLLLMKLVSAWAATILDQIRIHNWAYISFIIIGVIFIVYCVLRVVLCCVVWCGVVWCGVCVSVCCVCLCLCVCVYVCFIQLHLRLVNLLQINWSALSRAQDVLRFVGSQTRIMLLFFYGPDVRPLLITALDEGMLEGTVECT